MHRRPDRGKTMPFRHSSNERGHNKGNTKDTKTAKSVQNSMGREGFCIISLFLIN